ncbi:MOB member 4, phocein [Homalodisca vitripennis]|nr:MOB member 4, phocein [Homalodisca vitripennis]
MTTNLPLRLVKKIEAPVSKPSEDLRFDRYNHWLPVEILKNPHMYRLEDFSRWAEEPFEEMDSTLAVQQYIQQQIRREPGNIELILTPPDAQDEGVWKYEHLRQFCMELNGLAVRLQRECQPDSCTQMTATEQWIFLCAAHKTPKECPAIDYTRHTLDGAACLLNSNKYFPSRYHIRSKQ